ncbi:MAG TPA: Sec-independent protein translocase subunit TatA [Mycobacteriales bacterium]|jgi:sec-independent protein translocase protein TatA|nr:Sec-independent protein translocase subunit TatA [Mycobacteriales bacterium]
MGAMRPWHIIVLVVVLLLLFGAKRLPDAARSLGRSMRIFKAETKGLMEDDVRGKAEAQSHRAPEDRVRDDQPSPLPQPGHVHDDRR